MCSESTPTISIVSSCPSNVMEWMSAAKRKRCSYLGKIQSCTKSDTFVYHCVLNKQATLLLEVCAPVHFMSGEYRQLTGYFCIRIFWRIVKDRFGVNYVIILGLYT